MKTFLIALGALVFLNGAYSCKSTTSQQRAAAVVGAYEAALDACIAQSQNYEEYAGCADEVDRQFQLTHKQMGDQK